MLVTLVIIIVVLIAAVLAYAGTRPNSFRIERSTSIKAAPATVYALIEDFHRWGGWSPWEKLDPALNRSFSGSPSGKGSIYEWQGNKKVGKGRMEIKEAVAPSRVKIQLDFFQPFEAHNTAEFILTPRGDSTDVTWAMYGPSPFIAKLMGLVMSMDKMVGKDFEKGLAAMKSEAEQRLLP